MAKMMDFKEGVQRLAELTTLFSRCRREIEVEYCLCELCRYHKEHDEYSVILEDSEIFNKGNPEVNKLLPPDVLEELRVSV